MPWAQLYETSTDALSVLDQIKSVLEELRVEDSRTIIGTTIKVGGTIHHIQNKSGFARFSQPIAFVIEISKGVNGRGTVLSIATGDVGRTSSSRGVDLISQALEHGGTTLTPLPDLVDPSEYVRLQQEAYGRLADPMLAGTGFEAALREGLKLDDAAFWVNRAIRTSPWDEGPEVVERVRSLLGPLDEEHQVGPAVIELKPALEAAEQGRLTSEELLRLHDDVTLIVRWTFMAAARWLIHMHPAKTDIDKLADEHERRIFEMLRLDLRMFDSMLLHKSTKGEVIPLLDGIGMTCFEILAARQRCDEKLSKE